MERNYNAQSIKEVVGRSGQQRVKVAGTRDTSRIIKQSETGSTSRLSYVQQCTQPGNQAGGTVALCVASEI